MTASIKSASDGSHSRRRLRGKVALITGTGGGQGRAAALLFAREGALVVGCDVKDEGARETVEMVVAEGGHMTSASPVDLADSGAAREWVDAAAALHGRLDVLYNNASLPRFASVAEMSDDDWHFTVRNELDLVFFACRAAWPYLVERGGSIINTGSTCGVSAVPETPGSVAHAATKGGVIALTRVLAHEGGPYGVRANALSPGIIQSPVTAEKLEQRTFHEQHMDALMLRRIGQGGDVASAALFLASDESSWITGTNLMVDGGYSAH